MDHRAKGSSAASQGAYTSSSNGTRVPQITGKPKLLSSGLSTKMSRQYTCRSLSGRKVPTYSCYMYSLL